MKIAVVVLNFNDGELTKKYSMVLSEMKIIDKIIVVDNNSTDNSSYYLSCLEKTEKITVIYNNSNCGYATGNNVGLKYIEDNFSEIEYVIISNPDIEVYEDDIRKIIGYMDRYKDAFAMSGVVCNRNNAIIKNFRYKLPTCSLLFLESSCLLRRLGRFFGFTRQYQNNCGEKILKAEAIPGCFFVARFDVFKKLQFFDERTFLYFEEDILFTKAKINGYNSYIVMDSKIKHLEGISICKNIANWVRRERIYQKSCLIYMKEYLGIGRVRRFAYCVWNFLFAFERYLNAKIRTKYL